MTSSKQWLLLFFISCEFSIVIHSSSVNTASSTEFWTGKWFPEPPPTPIPHSSQYGSNRIPMGITNSKCDDGKTNITLDWDGMFGDYICTRPRSRFIPDASVDSVIEFENVPKAYMAPHFCMDKVIRYHEKLPTFGAHRPLWPVFGEYKYLPKQRWLHTLEHGGIVGLYHPCTDLQQISLLKELVRSCLRRHVISPSTELTPERPVALIAWGVRYTMSTIYPNAVRQFIKENALKGPEKLAKEGQYDFMLIKAASIVSDFEDSNLCPDA